MPRVLLLSALATALLASPGAEAFVGPALAGLRLNQAPALGRCGLTAAPSALLAAAGGQQSAMMRGWSLPPRVRAAGGVRAAVASTDVETIPTEVEIATLSSEAPAAPSAGPQEGAKKMAKKSPAAASFKKKFSTSIRPETQSSKSPASSADGKAKNMTKTAPAAASKKKTSSTKTVLQTQSSKDSANSGEAKTGGKNTTKTSPSAASNKKTPGGVAEVTNKSGKGPAPSAGAKTAAKNMTKSSPRVMSVKVAAGGAVKTGSVKVVESYDKELVREAFDAFAFTLLRAKGRSRFATINNAFRREFAMFRDESTLSNQTVGRFVQAWYLRSTGTPLKKGPTGVYMNMTMLNYNINSVDLSRLRAAQARIDPTRRKTMESLGLMEAGGSTKSEVRLRGATGEKLGAKEEALLAQRSKGRGTSAARAKVGWKDRAAGAKGVVSTGGNAVIAALAVRGAGGKGAGAVVVAGVKDPQDELREAFQLCMDSFVNTMLVVGGEGETTFRDICVLFKRHYPILSTVNNTLFTEAGLGRRVAEWYDKKTGQKITRIEKASNNLPRSQQPFAGLNLRSMDEVDLTLMNEAKVKLRRTLKLEGVGVMVKRSRAGEFAVAAIIPGSPAALEGSVEPGDVILAVDDLPVSSMTPSMMADAVLGVRGSMVALTLRRAAREGEAAGYWGGAASVVEKKEGGAWREGDGVLERVFSVDLMRSDKAVAGAVISEMELAERFRQKQTFAVWGATPA